MLRIREGGIEREATDLVCIHSAPTDMWQQGYSPA